MVDWTENDTSDMLDLMEGALTRVKTGLSQKLGKLGKNKQRSGSPSNRESIDSLETFVCSAQSNTVSMVEEISKGWKSFGDI